MPFHVTPAKNVPKIMSQGLTPQIGALSEHFETQKAVYLFKTLDDVSNALGNWLDLYVDEDETLTLLEVQVPPDAEIGETDADYEIVVLSTIPPQYIKVVYEDLDTIVF